MPRWGGRWVSATAGAQAQDEAPWCKTIEVSKFNTVSRISTLSHDSAIGLLRGTVRPQMQHHFLTKLKPAILRQWNRIFPSDKKLSQLYPKANWNSFASKVHTGKILTSTTAGMKLYHKHTLKSVINTTKAFRWCCALQVKFRHSVERSHVLAGNLKIGGNIKSCNISWRITKWILPPKMRWLM